MNPNWTPSSSSQEDPSSSASTATSISTSTSTSTSSSIYPPIRTAAYDYAHACTTTITTLLPTTITTAAPIGAPEPSPPPSLQSPAAGDLNQDQASSFTSTWLTPATPGDLAADDDDYDDTNFVFENGRRYHAPASGRVLYPLPNDESEQERDDMKHKLALWMMHEKLFYAPVEETLKHGGMVFDLGTGTGEWAMDLAQKYGKSQVFGCDISPIQPAYVWDNVFFSTGDFEEEWADYPENAFDYIHMRYTAFAIKDPGVLLQRVMRHLKPGGYVEFQEMIYWPRADDATLTDTTPYAFRDLCYYLQLGLANLGLNLHTIGRIPGELRSQGYDDVTEVRHKLPIGRWAKDRRQRQKGIWFLRMILMEGLSAIAKRPLSQGLGWKDAQIEMFLVDVRRSLNDSGVHAYFPFTIVYGRKPLESGDAGESVER